MGYVFPEDYKNFALEDESKEITQYVIQMNLLAIPKKFGEAIKISVLTNIPLGEEMTVSVFDLDSILSNEPEGDSDTLLGRTRVKVGKSNVFFISLTDAMRKAAFSDIEFSAAECYVTISHKNATTAVSPRFSVANDLNEKSFSVSNPSKTKGLNLNDIQKAKFIATLFGESKGEYNLRDIAYIYLNTINESGFEKGLCKSSFYNLWEVDRWGTYRYLMYLLGHGEEFANEKILVDAKRNVWRTVKQVANGDFVKTKVIPNLNKLKKFADDSIFVENPVTNYIGWTGQGFWQDMNIRITNPTYKKIWALASQYYYLQLSGKVKKIFVFEYKSYDWTGLNITTFLYDSNSLFDYFEKYPDMIPTDVERIPKMLYFGKTD